MSAVRAFKVATRQERLDAFRTQWIQEAIDYLYKLGVYAPDELEGANELAETIWENSDNEIYFEDHALRYSAVDAVDSELSYWGE